MNRYRDPGRIGLVVCGEPVVGRALVLLLRGSSRYDVRFLSASSLKDPGALEGVRLLLLTPEFRLPDSFPPATGDDLNGIGGTLVLQLVTSSEKRLEGETRRGPVYLVPWPCSTRELERRIEAALSEEPWKDPIAETR